MSKDDLIRYLKERLQQHVDNLILWQTGRLNPTEPDEQERDCIQRELKAAIYELKVLAHNFGLWEATDVIPRSLNL